MTSIELNALLDFLDADREHAAERYELLRRRLVRFFQWKGCLEAEEMADETFDRVARRLARGDELGSVDRVRFLNGVARLIFLESTRKPGRNPVLLETRDHPTQSAEEPDEARQALVACLEELRPKDRAMLLAYHDFERVVDPEDGTPVLEESASGAKGERRKELAERFGLNLNTLRIRVHRIRGRLVECVRMRLKDEIFRKP